MAEAVKEISERTNGGVNIEFYPANQLGDYIVVYEEVMQGTIDMACITATSHVDQRVNMIYIPYLITNFDEAKKVWTEGSYFFAQFNKVQNDAGVKLLGLHPGGLMGIGAAKPINVATAFDFSVPKNDILLRLPPLEILQITADTMQFRTTSIPYADLFPALQTGIVDGWIGGGPELNYTGFRDAIKYYYDYKYIDDTFGMFMNLKLFNSMPAEYQAVITDVFKAKSIEAIDAQQAKDDQFLKDLAAYGIEVIIPTQAQRNEMAAYMREHGWPKLEDMFGADVMAALIDDVL